MEIVSKISFGLLNGVIRGSVLALLASGLNVVFGLMKTVNVAHGSLYMFGAYLAWTVFTGLGSFWLSLVISPLLVGLIGIAIGLTLKPVRKDSLLSVLGTFGAALILQGISLVVWGGTPRRLPLPVEASFAVFGTGYSFYRIIIAVISILVLFLLWLILERTRFGLLLRATEEDRELSTAIGVHVTVVYLMGFGLSGALAGLSGALTAPTVSLTPEMGLRIFSVVFLIVIIGGLGRIWSSVIVAVSFAVVRGLATAFLNPTAGLIIAFSLVLVLVLIRPDWSGGGSGNASQN